MNNYPDDIGHPDDIDHYLNVDDDEDSTFGDAVFQSVTGFSINDLIDEVEEECIIEEQPAVEECAKIADK